MNVVGEPPAGATPIDQVSVSEHSKRQKWIIPHLSVVPGAPLHLNTLIKSGASAVMLTTNALGSVGDKQLIEIQKATKKGIPVFILPDNPGERHGVVRMVDAQQLYTQKAGATFLEEANDATQVLSGSVGKVIIEELNAGKRGQKLARAVQERFKLEKIPSSPLEKGAGLHDHMKSMGLE